MRVLEPGPGDTLTWEYTAGAGHAPGCGSYAAAAGSSPHQCGGGPPGSPERTCTPHTGRAISDPRPGVAMWMWGGPGGVTRLHMWGWGGPGGVTRLHMRAARWGADGKGSRYGPGPDPSTLACVSPLPSFKYTNITYFTVYGIILLLFAACLLPPKNTNLRVHSRIVQDRP